MKTKTCPVCGAVFSYEKETRMYCSPCCRNKAAHRKRNPPKTFAPRACVCCGMVFETNSPNKKYCSKECLNKVLNKKRIAEWAEMKEGYHPTPLSRYLWCIWHREGMTPDDIAAMVNVDVSVVEKTLNEEMAKGRYSDYKSSYWQWKRGA